MADEQKSTNENETISREDKNMVIKQLLNHRSRVAMKMSIIAQDLMTRSRRHDNSYSGDTEIAIAVKANSPIPSIRERNKKLLKGIHDTMNDYCPAYFKGGIKDMTMIQLIEFIADRMARCEEESVTEDGRPKEISFEDYYNFMKGDLGDDVPDALQSIILNTIQCIIDNNKYTAGMLKKKGMELEEYVKVKEK